MEKLIVYLWVGSLATISIIPFSVLFYFAIIWIRLRGENNPILKNYSRPLPIGGILKSWHANMCMFMYDKAYLKLPNRPLKAFIIRTQPIYHFLYNKLFSWALIVFFILFVLLLMIIFIK